MKDIELVIKIPEKYYNDICNSKAASDYSILYALDGIRNGTQLTKGHGNSICPCCGENKFKDLDADIWADWKPKYCPNCGAKMIEQKEDKNKKCEDCTEWEYFDGYGYGCFCMKTMTPIDANKCEFYTDKRPDIPQSWKPSNVEPQESEV